MSSEYYSLEKAAEVLALPTAEVNRLREKSALRAFRDGTTWKFRKVDVDNYLAETIKSRSKGSSDGASAGESDFDLLSMDDDGEEMPTLLADSASFDALMEDGLPMENEMISAAPSVSAKADDDGLSLDADDLMMVPDDDLILAADDDLVLDSGGGISLDKGPEAAPIFEVASSSDVDLAVDDDLVLDSGSSNQLDLVGDSGLSLLDVTDEIELQPADKGGSDVLLELDDDDDILSLVDEDIATENTSTIAIPVEDDFQLTPDAGMGMADDSESASQVIALDEDNMFGAPMDMGAVPESPFGAMPNAAPTEPTPAPAFGGFASGPSPVQDFSAMAAPAPATTSAEPTYGVGWVAALVILAFIMALPAIMLFDLIRNMWSWNEPFVVNSSIMDLIAGMAGWK